MFPKEFTERLEHQEYIDRDSLLRALGETSPSSIRINTGKFNHRPADSSPVEWCTTGYYLGKRPVFTADPLFHAGCYYPQEASGMFLEQLFSQKIIPDGEIKVLDLCGAPGGKSTHLASLISGRGLLVTNEVIRPRASILAENITKWGIPDTIVTQNDPADVGRLSDFFDVILVDAPCSGEGMFRNPEAVNEWSEENAFHCSERQKRILMDVWPALKTDGILIYSTCTFNPAENEQNIKWLLGKHEAENQEINISGFPGITAIDYEGIKGYGFHPGKIRGEGLFMAVIRKTGRQERHVRRVNERSAFRRAGKDEINTAKSWGDFPEDQIVKSGDDILHIPCTQEEFRILSSFLRIIKPGTTICTVKSRDFIPSHELTLSVNLKKDSFNVAVLDYNQAIAFLKRETLVVHDVPQGWFVPVYKGVNLGLAKNIGNRINNYYPVGWRIRMTITEDAGGGLIRWDR